MMCFPLDSNCDKNNKKSSSWSERASVSTVFIEYFAVSTIKISVWHVDTEYGMWCTTDMMTSQEHKHVVSPHADPCRWYLVYFEEYQSEPGHTSPCRIGFTCFWPHGSMLVQTWWNMAAFVKTHVAAGSVCGGRVSLGNFMEIRMLDDLGPDVLQIRFAF